jgi:ATP-dependent Lhr-like helicase
MGGLPALYLERGGRSLVPLRDPDAWLEPAVAALAAWVRGERGRRVAIERFDGASVFGSAAHAALRDAGFAEGLRAMELRGEG